jgi:uncharacterized protein
MVINSRFSGQIALITGASTGIGASTALFLSRQGVRVILVARNEDKLSTLCSSINKNNGHARYFAADLTIEADRKSIFETLSEQKELPDILINNAGAGWYGYFSDMPWSVASALISLNVEAVVHLTQMFLPSMLNKKHGHIINIGSVAGKLPEQGVAIYAASKAFLDSFTTSIHRDLKETGIKVSVLRAGPIKTEFFENARNLSNGGDVPAENAATSVDGGVNGIWSLLNHPRRVLYVPWFQIISPLLEIFFAGIIDLVGPLLLKNMKK